MSIGATSEQGGTRSHTTTIGGSSALPFRYFEGNHPHRPAVAMEVFDKPPDKMPAYLIEYFGDVIDKPGETAKKCVEQYGAELVSVRLKGTHPDKGNRSADEAADVVRQVLASVQVPPVISGHSHYTKINEVMKKICEIAAGENCLINYSSCAAGGFADLLAELFIHGFIDRSGKLREDRAGPRVIETNRGKGFRIEEGAGCYWAKDLITENDIANIIRTKGAIFSACSLMLKNIGLSLQAIDAVYIAGGFGRYLNIENAIRIGLFPDLDGARFHYLLKK